MHYTMHTDGGARGNPGPSGAGAIIHNQDDTVVARISEFLGERTNNFAEYEAVILGLSKLLELIPSEDRPQTTLTIKMDSELIVRQMSGIYKVKNPVLKEQYARVTSLIAPFKTVSFVHVPREENTEADALANEAMDRGGRA